MKCITVYLIESICDNCGQSESVRVNSSYNKSLFLCLYEPGANITLKQCNIKLSIQNYQLSGIIVQGDEPDQLVSMITYDGTVWWHCCDGKIARFSIQNVLMHIIMMNYCSNIKIRLLCYSKSDLSTIISGSNKSFITAAVQFHNTDINCSESFEEMPIENFLTISKLSSYPNVIICSATSAKLMQPKMIKQVNKQKYYRLIAVLTTNKYYVRDSREQSTTWIFIKAEEWKAIDCWNSSASIKLRCSGDKLIISDFCDEEDANDECKCVYVLSH